MQLLDRDGSLEEPVAHHEGRRLIERQGGREALRRGEVLADEGRLHIALQQNFVEAEDLCQHKRRPLARRDVEPRHRRVEGAERIRSLGPGGKRGACRRLGARPLHRTLADDEPHAGVLGEELLTTSCATRQGTRLSSRISITVTSPSGLPRIGAAGSSSRSMRSVSSRAAGAVRPGAHRRRVADQHPRGEAGEAAPRDHPDHLFLPGRWLGSCRTLEVRPQGFMKTGVPSRSAA